MVKKQRRTNKNKREKELVIARENLERAELEARQVLCDGAKLAAETLIATMTAENATNAIKVDCAKEILTRLFGKTLSAIDQPVDSVVVSDALTTYSE